MCFSTFVVLTATPGNRVENIPVFDNRHFSIDAHDDADVVQDFRHVLI